MERNIVGFFVLVISCIGLGWLLCHIYENDDVVGCDGPTGHESKMKHKRSKHVQLCRHQIKFGWFRTVFSSPWIPFETRGIYIYGRITLVSMLWTIKEQFGRFEILKYSKNHTKHSFFGFRLRILSLKHSQIKFPFREHFYGPLWPIYGKRKTGIKYSLDMVAPIHLTKVRVQNGLLFSTNAEKKKPSLEEFLEDPGYEPWKLQYLDLRGAFLDKNIKIRKSYYGDRPIFVKLDSETYRKMAEEVEVCKKHFFDQVYERMVS